MSAFSIPAALMLALAMAAPASESWRMASSGGTAPARTMYLIDAKSVVKTGTLVRFRTQSIWESTTDSRDFDRTVTTRRGDCVSMSSAVIENHFFNDGEETDVDTSVGKTIAHGPDSMMYEVMRRACGSVAMDPTEADEKAVRFLWSRTK